ncbi:MAG: hypothetical protein QM820_12420 [Minicystis sp.]
MGLDASVYCACFETGRLRSPPPAGVEVYVCEDGSLDCRGGDQRSDLAFDAWLFSKACDHENGTLLHHRIGNIALVSLLREELGRRAEIFPTILARVIYNGSHCGDWLTMGEVQAVQLELGCLRTHRCGSVQAQDLVQTFRRQMEELAVCSLQVGKPISF